jgi:hypothetical protein
MASPLTLLNSTARLADDLDFEKQVERIVDAIGEASEEVLARSHMGRALAEAATPEGSLELTRVWREIDAVFGPGKSTVEALVARYPSLNRSIETIGERLRQAWSAEVPATRALVLNDIDRELKVLSRLKADLVATIETDVAEVSRQLQKEVMEGRRMTITVPSTQRVRTECERGLDEIEQSIRRLRNQISAQVRKRVTLPGAVKLQERARALVTALIASGGKGPRAVIASRIKRLSQFAGGDPQALGAEFARNLRRRVRGVLPVVEDIEDSALVFMDTLGVVASARPEGAQLLRRYVEGGAGSLTEEGRRRVRGYLGQLLGIMPEEIATRMKFLDGIFYKRAFEGLSEFPPTLRSQMSVEMVEGPLWVVSGQGAARQFGDGSMLLTGPNGQSAIIGLGEFKAGFDEDLLRQLFVRSDDRAVTGTIAFIGADGNHEIRTLTRHFTFEGGQEVSLRTPPIYVYGRPAGEAPETAARFRQMVDEQMRSGREMWKIQLPFSASDNKRFAEEALTQAVLTLKAADKTWGLPPRKP